MYNIQKVTEEDEKDLNWIDEAEADVEETHRRHHHKGPLFHRSEKNHSGWNMKKIVWTATHRRHHHQGPLLHLSEEDLIFHSD